MLPMYKEVIDFLNLKTRNALSFLEEGYYWYERKLIKAFDLFGREYTIAKINLDEKLEIKVELRTTQVLMLESWTDTINRNIDRLNQIEQESVELINKSLVKYNNRKKAVLISGGKDSSVTLHLVRKCIQNKNDLEIIFNNTSLDCADTYKYVKNEKNVTIINPEKGFYQWIKEKNFIPTRFARACCSIFKEGAMVDTLPQDSSYIFFMGMRNEESHKRANYLDEWKNDKWENRQWDAILPIRKWSSLEVWLYILKENIPVNTKYKKGYNRVGCAIACPFCNDYNWALDEFFYPTLTDKWRNILKEDFIKNNKDIIMNCTIDEYIYAWNGGIVRDEPTQQVIEEFSRRNNLDYDVAKKYFNHKCVECNKKVKGKEVIGMNLKFNGRTVSELYCKKHLTQKLNMSNKEWKQWIEIFKQQECDLF